MPAETEHVKKLKEWYKKARNSGLELNFALALGDKDDGMLVIVDKKKPPQKLLLDAKDEGETNKFAMGTMKVLKDEVRLTCIKKPATGTAKKLKKYLKLIKMPGAPSLVIIVDDQGVTLETDGESETDGTAPATDGEATSDAVEARQDESASPPPDPLKERWETGLKKLGPVAMQRIKAGGTDAKKLAQLLKSGKDKAAEGNYAAALKVLPAIAQVLKTQAAEEPAPESSAKPETPKAEPGPAKLFQERRAQILPELSAAVKQKSPHVAEAKKALEAALEAAKAKDYSAGVTYLDEVSRILAQPIPESPPAEETPPKSEEPELPQEPSELEGRLVMTARAIQKSRLPDDETDRLSRALVRAGALLKKGDDANCEALLDMIAKALSAPAPAPKPSGREIAAQVRDVWDDANKVVNGRLAGLRKAFGEVDDPNCQELADKGLISFTGGLYVKLNKSFLELQAAGPDKIDTACIMADDTFRAFQQMLDSHEAVQLIDQNHFGVTIGLSDTLGGALDEMRDIVRNPAAA